MRRATWLCALALVGCSPPPSRVRVAIALAADATDAASGPARLRLFGAGGSVLSGSTLNGTLPGDVVVLVDDDVGELRGVVDVSRDTVVVAQGFGRVSVQRGTEVRLPVMLWASSLPDLDGDGVPDEIDDCPRWADPDQAGPCGEASEDLSTSPPDLGAPPDLAMQPCGNGTLDPGEACDTGMANSDDPAAASTCTTACKTRAPCGTLVGAAGSRIDRDSGHCYVAWSGPATFTAAERDCLGRGGHLAAVTAVAEHNLVRQLVASASWIGLVAGPAGSANVWTTTESGAYEAYRAGEPTRTGEGCVVTLPGNGGWEDRACGWPAVGLLPASTASTAGYVCEHSCGNGVVDPGEACDPPGPTCTATCRTIRTCTELAGMTSPATGACYFKAPALMTYTSALASACPAGTHLATPSGPHETETAAKATDVDAWIAVRAPTTVAAFNFDVAGFPYDRTRYHGFLAPDPDLATAPACTVLSKVGDGWRDRDCTLTYPALCQRD